MRITCNVALLLLTTVDAFQPMNLVGTRISSQGTSALRRPLTVYSEPPGDSVVLEDVDGVGAVLENKNLTASRVDLDEEKKEGLQNDIMQLLIDVEEEATKATEEMMDEECDFDMETGGPKDELCVEGEEREGFRAKLKKTIGSTLKMIRGMPASEDESKDEGDSLDGEVFKGDLLEQGWNERGSVSALRRNAEVWKFALKAVFRVLKPRSMRKKGASDKEVEQAQIEAAEFIRDGLLTLGPTFVKLGQVCVRRLPFCPMIGASSYQISVIGRLD